MRGLRFHVFQRVVAFGLQNQESLAAASRPDDKIGQILVVLAVVQIGDRKSKSSVLDKRVYQLAVV